MDITVIGCGRWGSFIAWYLNRIGHDVTLYGRESSKNMQRFIETRENDFIKLPESIKLTTSLECLIKASTIIISVNSQGLGLLMAELSAFHLTGKTFVLCMKGIEVKTGRRLSEIASDALDNTNQVAVWLGPGHVQEFYSSVPNCMVIDSDNDDTKQRLIEAFSSDLIRFYYGTDLIGNEVGAAAKNVIGIAAGMLDGLRLTTLKGALMSRGTREVARLISAMGGNELSAYGLCHLGDYEATVFSEHSQNRRFGEMYILGKPYGKLAEGYYTTKALVVLANKYGVELPISSAVYNILYTGADPKTELGILFTRSLTQEY